MRRSGIAGMTRSSFVIALEFIEAVWHLNTTQARHDPSLICWQGETVLPTYFGETVLSTYMSCFSSAHIYELFYICGCPKPESEDRQHPYFCDCPGVRCDGAGPHRGASLRNHTVGPRRGTTPGDRVPISVLPTCMSCFTLRVAREPVCPQLELAMDSDFFRHDPLLIISSVRQVL